MHFRKRLEGLASNSILNLCKKYSGYSAELIEDSNDRYKNKIFYCIKKKHLNDSNYSLLPFKSDPRQHFNHIKNDSSKFHQGSNSLTLEEIPLKSITYMRMWKAFCNNVAIISVIFFFFCFLFFLPHFFLPCDAFCLCFFYHWRWCFSLSQYDSLKEKWYAQRKICQRRRHT